MLEAGKKRLFRRKSRCQGYVAEEQRRTGVHIFGSLVSCVMFGKLIALGLSFLFCTIAVMIPTLQGSCCKE